MIPPCHHTGPSSAYKRSVVATNYEHKGKLTEEMLAAVLSGLGKYLDDEAAGCEEQSLDGSRRR
jgi:hypothetical protein